MVSLDRIVERALKRGATSSRMRSGANTNLVGILWWNCFAGRSDDWQKLKAADVHRQLFVQGKNFIEFLEYKTARYYGDLGKWVPGGTAAAIKRYMQLPADDARDTDQFLKPARGADVPIATCLKRVGLRHTPYHQAPGVNIVRKLFHTKLMDMTNNDSVLELISRVDRHSEGVAATVHATKDPEGDAKLGEILFNAVLGEPVPWPSEGELRLQAAAGDRLLAEIMRIEAMPEAGYDDDIPEFEVYNNETTVQLPPLADASAADASPSGGGGEVVPFVQAAGADSDTEEYADGAAPDAAAAGDEAWPEVETGTDPQPAKRGRMSRCSPKAKRWSVAKNLSSFGEEFVAPHVCLKNILDEGIACEILPRDANVETVSEATRPRLRKRSACAELAAPV